MTDQRQYLRGIPSLLELRKNQPPPKLPTIQENQPRPERLPRPKRRGLHQGLIL